MSQWGLTFQLTYNR